VISIPAISIRYILDNFLFEKTLTDLLVLHHRRIRYHQVIYFGFPIEAGEVLRDFFLSGKAAD